MNQINLLYNTKFHEQSTNTEEEMASETFD